MKPHLIERFKSSIFAHEQFTLFLQQNLLICQSHFELYKKTLPKAQRTQSIESLNFNEFFEPTSESRSNFNLVLFGQVQEIYITIFTNPRKTLTIQCYNCDSSCANSSNWFGLARFCKVRQEEIVKLLKRLPASSDARVTSVKSQKEEARKGNDRTLVR